MRGFFISKPKDLFPPPACSQCATVYLLKWGGPQRTIQEPIMKSWIIVALCLFGLAGCASEYIITTTDGQILTSDGKPELDKDTGMLEFTDSEGRKQQIPQSSVKQMLER